MTQLAIHIGRRPVPVLPRYTSIMMIIPQNNVVLWLYAIEPNCLGVPTIRSNNSLNKYMFTPGTAFADIRCYFPIYREFQFPLSENHQFLDIGNCFNRETGTRKSRKLTTTCSSTMVESGLFALTVCSPCPIKNLSQWSTRPARPACF